MQTSEKFIALQEIVYREARDRLLDSGIDSTLAALIMQGVVAKFYENAFAESVLRRAAAESQAAEEHTGTPEELLHSLKGDEPTL